MRDGAGELATLPLRCVAATREHPSRVPGATVAGVVFVSMFERKLGKKREIGRIKKEDTSEHGECRVSHDIFI
jgi:hypothetical protein